MWVSTHAKKCNSTHMKLIYMAFGCCVWKMQVICRKTIDINRQLLLQYRKPKIFQSFLAYHKWTQATWFIMLVAQLGYEEFLSSFHTPFGASGKYFIEKCLILWLPNISFGLPGFCMLAVQLGQQSFSSSIFQSCMTEVNLAWQERLDNWHYSHLYFFGGRVWFCSCPVCCRASNCNITIYRLEDTNLNSVPQWIAKVPGDELRCLFRNVTDLSGEIWSLDQQTCERIPHM